MRVAIIGGIAMVLFGVIFFRLWYLQVLSGEQYVQQADANRVRDCSPIPRATRSGRSSIREGRGGPAGDRDEHRPAIERPTPSQIVPSPRCRPAAAGAGAAGPRLLPPAWDMCSNSARGRIQALVS
jgi:hypothetical protein